MTTRKESEDFLAHHGVLGMKWGRHLPGRGDEPRKAAKTKPEPHPDYVEARKLSKTPNKQLSTNDIKKLNNRLQTERQNKDLDPKGISRGAKAVAGVLGITGVGILAYNQITGPAGQKAIALGRKAVSNGLDKYAAAKLGNLAWKTIQVIK